MTLEERNEERQALYNSILIAIQMGLAYPHTFEDVYKDFRRMMLNSKIGECTEDDEAWLYEQLEEWNRYVTIQNEEYEKKKRKKKKQG